MTTTVSVILPVYNGDTYLRAAIESILSQSYSDLELVVLDDGSTDTSWNIINSFSDPRIQAVQQTNRGLAATLNEGIRLSRGRYIARQDQDDISHPRRIEQQVSFLDHHVDYGLLGTGATIWKENQPTNRTLLHPTDSGGICFSMMFDNAFVHSTVMMRRKVIMEVGGYNDSLTRNPPEDYELWSRIMRVTRVANLGETLLTYRETAGSMSREPGEAFMNQVMAISAGNIAWLLQQEDTDLIAEVVAVYHGKTSICPQRPWSAYDMLLNRILQACCDRYQVAPVTLSSVFARVRQQLHDRYHRRGRYRLWHRLIHYVLR